jgi:hypothetical protein
MTKTLFRGEEPVETDPRTLIESWPDWKIDGFRALLTPAALDVYKSFGYDLFELDRPASIPVQLPSEPRRPIFLASVMKSGTWLLRAILEDMTGLKGHEPQIGEGTPAYDDEMLIDIPPGHFFSWHSVLNDRSTALLRGAGTKNIFLVRNVFDLIVSMYNHLRRDADASIGRSVKGSDYLAQLAPDAAMSMMVSGFTSPELTWDGIGPHIRQIASFFRFREEGGDALILSYEELTRDKANTVRKIAQYLEIPIDDQRVVSIVSATEFDTMKEKASKRGVDGHFTDYNDRAVKRAIQPYHVAMVNRIAMTEMPNASEQTAKAGMPWLFDYREN